MKNLNNILKQIENGKLSVNDAQSQILNIFGTKESVSKPIEEPVLVGELNKVFGYNGFKKLLVGTPVYSFKDRYYFEMIPINGGVPVRQKFYKETLSPCIKFIKNEKEV